jgi:nitrous oxide reductase
MDGQHGTTGRRNLLRTLTTMGIATAAIAGSYRPAAAETATTSNRGKRQSQYQANSAEVKTFYRVNSYPAN